MPHQFEIDGRRLEAVAGTAWLAEVEVPTSPLTRLRVTSDNEQVSFGESLTGRAVVYQPVPMRVGVITRTKEGNLPQMQIGVANVHWQLMPLLEEHAGLVGQPAVVRLVSLAELSNFEAQLRFDGEVVGVEVTPSQVVFSIGSYNLKQISFPKNRFVAEHCRFRFGGPECAYNLNHPLASFTECPKTFVACGERGDDEEDVMGVTRQHPERFGGWRALPPS